MRCLSHPIDNRRSHRSHVRRPAQSMHHDTLSDASVSLNTLDVMLAPLQPHPWRNAISRLHRCLATAARLNHWDQPHSSATPAPIHPAACASLLVDGLLKPGPVYFHSCAIASKVAVMAPLSLIDVTAMSHAFDTSTLTMRVPRRARNI